MMRLREEFSAALAAWRPLPLYEKFERAVMLVLTALISIVVVFAVWNLAVKLIVTIVLSGVFDPTDYAVFQALFGMIFTVLIALEFQRSWSAGGGKASRYAPSF
jgi:uncharacterized membrane protein (DUF373 family)